MGTTNKGNGIMNSEQVVEALRTDLVETNGILERIVMMTPASSSYKYELFAFKDKVQKLFEDYDAQVKNAVAKKVKKASEQPQS